MDGGDSGCGNGFLGKTFGLMLLRLENVAIICNSIGR